MGLKLLAKDVFGGLGGALKETVNSSIWKEYFESGDMSKGILMKRGERIITGNSKNTRADNNLISSGAGIDVQEGQCVILVDNGKITDFCAEAGRYTFDSSTAPSLYAGDNRGLKALGKEILSQWSAGGQRFSTQRIYFINMGEIIYTPIKWGSGDIAFHHTSVMANGAPPFEMDITLRGNGQVTVQIVDPVKFFEIIGAQKTGTDSDSVVSINDEGILSNLKSGIVDKVTEAISALGYEQHLPYTAIRSKSDDIRRLLNESLSNEWMGKRGFEICSFSINGAFLPSEEDIQEIQDMQKTFSMGANLNAANYDIQKTVARGIENAGETGGSSALLGIGMGMNAVGGAALGQMQNQMNPNNTGGAPVVENSLAWTCPCGAVVTGNFCQNCGLPKPEEKKTDEWSCGCGQTNTGKFCMNCGKSKEEALSLFVCEKCGWKQEPGTQAPKFCPECGDPV